MRRPLTIIGIDPSAQAGGYCVDLGDQIIHGTVRIEDVGALPFGDWDADRVVFCVECPARMYRGSNHVVRSAANAWVHRIKKAYPRRTVPIGKDGKCDPAVWRAQVLRGHRGDDWKSIALKYTNHYLPGITAHDEAEAFCIMVYARDCYRLQIARANAEAALKRKQKQ